MDTLLLDNAICLAVKMHAGVGRRAKGYPYIVHPLEALTIVATMTDDHELLAAAVLHDTIEDSTLTLEEVEQVCGKRVATLVASESADPSLGWRARRERMISHLNSASLEEKMVAMGDKLSNLRAIARDYKVLGDALWQRFGAPQGRVDYEWYYRSLGEALSELQDFEAYQEYRRLLTNVFDN